LLIRRWGVNLCYHGLKKKRDGDDLPKLRPLREKVLKLHKDRQPRQRKRDHAAV